MCVHHWLKFRFRASLPAASSLAPSCLHFVGAMPLTAPCCLACRFWLNDVRYEAIISFDVHSGGGRMVAGHRAINPRSGFRGWVGTWMAPVENVPIIQIMLPNLEGGVCIIKRLEDFWFKRSTLTQRLLRDWGYVDMTRRQRRFGRAWIVEEHFLELRIATCMHDK